MLSFQLERATHEAGSARRELERATAASLEHWMGRNGIDEIEVDVYSERAGQHTVRGYRAPSEVNEHLAALDQDVLRDLRIRNTSRAGYWLTRDALAQRASTFAD